MRYLSANQFEVYEEIGKGGFGVVYRGLDKVTKQQVAIKQIDLESTEDIEDLQREINTLSQCRLDQITRYHGCFVRGYKLWIIMELLDGGSCLDLLVPGHFKEKYISILLRELLIALQYLHENNRIHRDVKAANILLNSKGDVKIADFGVSTQLSNNLSKRNTFVGSPYWMSPEIILEEEYNFKTDIWSLGITAIELATGKPPLTNIPPMKALFQIPQSAPPILTGSEYSYEFRDFVKLCIQRNPNNRPSAKKLLEHPFIAKAGKNHQLLELIKRKQLWTFEHLGDKKIPQKNYYTPTIQDVSKNHDDISFDFGDSYVERSDISNVLIARKSPLEFNHPGRSIKIHSNVSPSEYPNTVDRYSNKSNVSTLRLNKTNVERDIPLKHEFNKVFNNSIERIGTEDEEQLIKLRQVGELLESLNDEVLVKFSKEFTKSVGSSFLFNMNNEKRLSPRKAESEKLLLKRWADQYFN